MFKKQHNENKPLITIITPTYKSNLKFLLEAINSVLIQTYPNIQYIISDDGSKEFPEELIRRYLSEHAGKNIQWEIIKHRKNIGTVKNLNYAIQKCCGEYIFFCSQDDSFFDEIVIDEWVTEFQNQNAIIITAIRELKKYKHNVSNLDNYSLPTENEKKWIHELSPKKLHEKLIEYNFISGSTTAYSRVCFEKYNLFDEQYYLLEDYPTYLKLTQNNIKIHFWNRTVINYRFGGVSTIKKINRYFLKDMFLITINKYDFPTWLNKFLKYSLYPIYWINQKLNLTMYPIGFINKILWILNKIIGRKSRLKISVTTTSHRT